MVPSGGKKVVVMPSHLRSVVDRDGAVILDIKGDQFFSMNPVGSYIWQRLLKGQGIDQIARELAEETRTEISLVIADINDFIADLKNKQLFDFPQ
jgi:Coenzyme PQQ synthesis protein D (PqqD)